jgi:hypothetical protein
MNPIIAGKNGPVKTAPPWRKRVLLVLLVISATAGVALNMPVIRQSATEVSSLFNEEKDSGTGRFSKFQTLFKKASFARLGETVTCQGMLVGENGVALAFIDGQTVESGATVSGVQVFEITATKVLVGCNGETRLLSPGESFTPGKR